MKIEKFEDIISWQKAERLTIDIYKIFEEIKDFGFKNQIQRSSVSIMNNIAEGFERKSNKELKYFLFVEKVRVQKLGQCYTYLYSSIILLWKNTIN